MQRFSLVFLLALYSTKMATPAGTAQPKSVDQVLSLYVQQLGGQAAVDRITSLELHAQRHHGPKLVYYWQKPNKALLVKGHEKFGFDGGSGWWLSKKRRVMRLPHGQQRVLQNDANPIRYVNLKSLYSNLEPGSPEAVDSKLMDVVVAPNDLGSTKFYFDTGTHLLSRIEDTGDISAYYKHVTEFMDYKEVDGIKFPFRIVHTTTEPGVGADDIRISKVAENVELNPQIFSKPYVEAVVLGGTR
jgi:hypothetical protein